MKENNNRLTKLSYILTAIVEAMRLNKIRQIFELLDSDHDGKISALNMDIEALPPEVYRRLFPILREIEERKIELDLETFS